MVLCTMGTMSMVKSMGEELLFGRMDLNIRDSFRTIILKEMVNINGLMEDLIMENGRTIKCMAKDSFYGQMEENTKGNISRIKSKGLGLFTGLMVENMWDNGEMESSMEEEPLLLPMVSKGMENGTLERERSGLMNDLKRY